MNPFVASIPSPPSGALELGRITLRAYGVLIALGVIAAIWLFGRQLDRHRAGTPDDASAIGIWSVAAGVIGARLYHVATEWSRFSDDLGSIPRIWEGGLGIPGGLVLGIATGAWMARRRGIAPAVVLSCAAPGIPLAQAIGRWGNWFNQELFGRPTGLPWALEIDDDHNLGYPPGTTFHPTFLYESLWNLGLVAVLLWIDRRFRLGPGRLMGVYVMGYGIGRFWVEALRIDPTDGSDVAGMRWNQWVALAAVAGAALYLVSTRRQTWPEHLGAPVGTVEPFDGRPDGVPDAREPAPEPVIVDQETVGHRAVDGHVDVERPDDAESGPPGDGPDGAGPRTAGGVDGERPGA